jgi:excisionase family DNA binding protein
MMDELLTTKQVQELLQVDRTTVYRMLKDGRLSGVKVGQQWRFSQQDVESLLSGIISADQEDDKPPMSLDVLPLNCVQAVQDVCAEIAEIGAVTTDMEGKPLTEISNCSRFCALILDTPSGYRACKGSWRRLADQDETEPRFVTCHAGLQYARAKIELNGESAMLIGGQFYTIPPDPGQRRAEMRALAEKHGIDADQLVEAGQDIPFLEQRKRHEITRWLKKVAGAFEQISCERADLMHRLERIADMSTLA